MAEAEREQFRLGRSDILRVTLREQAKFDADLLEIAARQEYWRADAHLRAADTSLDSVGLRRGPVEVVAPLPAEVIQLPPVIAD